VFPETRLVQFDRMGVENGVLAFTAAWPVSQATCGDGVGGRELDRGDQAERKVGSSRALREHIQAQAIPLEETLRKVIREELREAG
jgi:hypothetical protein